VLGLRFLRSLFEVITAPGASLKYHGENDHFFHSLLIVFFGGVVAATIMMVSQDKIVNTFSHYSNHVASDLAQANSNPTYRDVAENFARDRIDSNFNTNFVQYMVGMEMVFIIIWLALGLLCFVFSKMFGSGVSASDLLGTTAYSAFFGSIGLALATPLIIDFIASQAGAGGPTPDAMGIAGCVLLFYGVILFLMGISQAADLTSVQTVGILIMLLIVLGGLGYWGYSTGTKNFDAFRSKVTSYNPATGQSQL